MRSDLVDIEMVIHHRTPNAILASDDGDRDLAVWLPHSAIEIEPTKTAGTYIVTMPKRLAIEKGLV